MHVCMHISMHLCMYACMHVSMYLCMTSSNFPISIEETTMLWKISAPLHSKSGLPWDMDRPSKHIRETGTSPRHRRPPRDPQGKADFAETWRSESRGTKRTLPRHGRVPPHEKRTLPRHGRVPRYEKRTLPRHGRVSPEPKADFAETSGTKKEKSPRHEKGKADSAAQKRKVHQLLSCMMHYNSIQN